MIQLRAKTATDRETLAWAAGIRSLTRAAGVLFIVNDRFDLALAADADGVHLGQEDLPPERLPASARKQLLVGRSTHTLDQARASRHEPIDYLAFGPVFGTTSKDSAYDSCGIDPLARVVEEVAPLPVVAIGGIDASNARQVAAAGAAAIAVISAVAGSEDPAGATRRLIHAFQDSGEA